MKILTIEPYPNYHFRSIINEMDNEKFSIEKIYFEGVPNFRKGDEWVSDEKEFRKGYKACFKDILESDIPIFLGIFSPFPKMLILFIFSCIFKSKVFVASEGFKRKSSGRRLLKVLFSILSRCCNITFLCIGENSNNDYYELGFSKSNFRKFAFAELYSNYPRALFNADLDKYDSPTFNILLVGQLIKRKNFSSVIKSCLEYVESNPKKIINIDIAGEGPELINLKKLALTHKNLNCRFHGHVSKDYLEKLFRESHLFIIPSIYEGWGVVLNNAIHFGLPCICYNSVRSANDFLIKDDYNGNIISQNQINQTLKKYIEMSADEIKVFSCNSYKTNYMWSVSNLSSRLEEVLINDKIFFPDDGPLSNYVLR